MQSNNGVALGFNWLKSLLCSDSISGVFSSPSVLLDLTILCSQRSTSARKPVLTDHFSSLPFLQLPIWGPPYKTPATKPGPLGRPPHHREEEPSKTAPSLLWGGTGASLPALIFPHVVISMQPSLALTLTHPAYICITGRFIFIRQSFPSRPTIAMVMTSLFSATEAFVI